MNYSILIIVIILATALIVFLILKNQRDKKKFEQQMNRDYPHRKDQEGDIEIEDSNKV